MKNPAIQFLLLVTCTSFTVIAPGQSATQSGDSKRALIENKIAEYMKSAAEPGLSVAVVEDGKVAWSAGYGMADLENPVHATSQTLYRLASISKTLTATAAMKLVEDGKLDLDAPVQKYCPEFPQKTWPITTRELLNHTAGIRGYHVDESPYSISERDPEVGNIIHFQDGIKAGLAFFENDPLIAKPGTQFSYSTHGYTVVGCVIQGASGQKYADYVREHVLVPAGMTQTVLDDRLAIIPLRTRFYSRDASGRVINAEPLDSSYKIPGAGWLSSAADMARFEAAILTDRILTRKSRDLMWTPPSLKNGSAKSGYAFGWGVGVVNGLQIIDHAGLQQGALTDLRMVPSLQTGVIVLTNSDAGSAPKLASSIMDILTAQPGN